MENKSHLNIFDFDETLFRVPGYTSSEAKGMSPYEWFDSPESLSDKFNIRGIANTIEAIDPNSHNFLVTHRVKQCQNAVIYLISENHIKFTETFFLGRSGEKSEVVLNLIEKYDAESITIYEDSLWEIIKYTAWFLDAGLNLKIDFVFVDKSRVIKIDWDTARQLEEFAEADKLRLL